MTAVPQGIHEQTIQAAQTTAPMVTQPLIAKWIGFGQIPVFPDGTADIVDTDDIEGVASDLIIKPFDRLRDGKAQQAREAFAHLSESDQQARVESLTTLVASGFFQPWHRPCHGEANPESTAISAGTHRFCQRPDRDCRVVQ
jgi:hypothetical protein